MQHILADRSVPKSEGHKWDIEGMGWYKVVFAVWQMGHLRLLDVR
jgi:hypothetical protein